MIETNFKHTDIGPIPHDWEVKRLGDLMDIKSGDSITGDSFLINGKFPVYGGNGIRGFVNDFNINGDYILIGRVGALCGNIHIASGKSFASEHALVCHPNCKYNINFLSPILQGMNLGQYSGASAQPVLAAGKLSRLQISFPPLAEQEAIGKALSDVDGLIEGLRKLIEKKRNIKQGAMSRLLSGSLRLPGFNKSWVTRILGEIGFFIKGKGISRDESNSGTIPAIRYGEIYTNHSDYIKQFHSHISLEVANKSQSLQYGDICFAASGETLEDIGKAVAFINNFEAYAGGDIIIFRPKEKINPTFFGFLLNTPPIVRQKSFKGHGLSIMHIRTASLAELVINYPTDLAEQSAIAKVLTDMDSEIEKLEKKLAKYERVKQGMMKQLLTGKIRLI